MSFHPDHRKPVKISCYNCSMFTKHQKRLPTVLIVIAITVVGVVIYHRFIRTSVVVEDIANSCSYKNGDVIKSAVPPNLRYEDIPNYKVNEYVEKARDQSRYVDRQ